MTTALQAVVTQLRPLQSEVAAVSGHAGTLQRTLAAAEASRMQATAAAEAAVKDAERAVVCARV